MITARGLIAALLCLLIPATGWSSVADQQQLQQYYRQVDLQRAIDSQALPFEIESEEADGRLSANVYSLVEQPFGLVADTLTRADSWCEFMPLNPNIKSCISHVQAGQAGLRFYAGRKFYQTPDEAYELDYGFHVDAQDEGYIKVRLEAAEGPFGTRDYLILIEAIPVDSHTFLRIHTSYQTSLRSRLGTHLYLNTLGQDKVGFSTVVDAGEMSPVYIKGIRGIIERNVMRYYLALKACLDTSHLTGEQRFESRVKAWYDLTQHYPAQLYEVERNEYLTAKRNEWQNQQQLQQAVLTAD